MQLTPFCVMMTCLQVVPDRSQFFKYDSISLTCVDRLNSTGWKVKRITLEGVVKPCSGRSSASSDSTCIIGNTYPPDSGVYWCESNSGEQSNGVNITITDRPVILKSPAHPVSEGSSVTLRCDSKTNATEHVYDFYKDGRSISSSSRGEMIIHSASPSDEGLYKCSTSGGEESAGSWLAVEASPPPSPSSSEDLSSLSVVRLLCHLMVGTPYLLSTVLLGLIYRDRKRAAQTVTERRGGDNVTMEIVV